MNRGKKKKKKELVKAKDGRSFLTVLKRTKAERVSMVTGRFPHLKVKDEGIFPRSEVQSFALTLERVDSEMCWISIVAVCVCVCV
jgi:hypothetical protein